MSVRSGQLVGAVGRMTSGRLSEVTVVISIITGVYTLSSLSRKLKVFSV
jgi:glucose uptake protein GlcU